MNVGPMTATKLRFVLSITMLLILVVIVGGFYFAQVQLRNYGRSISQLNADAASGDKNLQILRSLEDKLKAEAPTIKKAQSIVAESKQYKYQDEIVQDLSRNATVSGVTISGFAFTSANATAPGTTSAQTTAPAANSSGLRSQTVTVSIVSPVSYDNIMLFIKSIELNPLKMQIASVSLSRYIDTDNKFNGNAVTPESFTIEVYVR
jgi:hypothetical protein